MKSADRRIRRLGTPRTVASLAGHAAIVGSGSSGTWNLVEDGEPRAVAVTPKLRVGTLLGVRAAALAGMGIAILPDIVVAGDLSPFDDSCAMPWVTPRIGA